MTTGTSINRQGVGVAGAPGYYHELIYWAVRISNSGEYIHSMPSTVWAQGHVNVSHGCVNSPP
ncbi:MAG: L,D-transpeptidase family protein, partial [Nocardioidaceae bacterium]